jgi:dihydrofolate reductase
MINLIACIDLNNAIGYKNQLLCKLPNDLKRFKELTTGQFIIMGSRTFESISKPLPNRFNIVLTRNTKNYFPDGAYVYHSVEDIIHEYENYGNKEVELWVIGGESIYKQFLPHADNIYLTIIDHAFSKADAYFPQFDINDWKVINHEQHKMDSEHLYNFHFVTYEKKIKNK